MRDFVNYLLPLSYIHVVRPTQKSADRKESNVIEAG